MIDHKRIDLFRGEYRFLSNFWKASVRFEGVYYPSAEHAYQAAKTLDLRMRDRIRGLFNPADAKRVGRTLDVRMDWDDVKVDVMRAILLSKFFDGPELANKLMATGHAVLVEGNNWGDVFWGVCRGKGENHLGKLLMEVRDVLRYQVKRNAQQRR